MDNKEDYETLNDTPQNNLKTNGYNPNLKQELPKSKTSSSEELPKGNSSLNKQLSSNEMPSQSSINRPNELDNNNQLKNANPYNKDLTNPLSKENNKDVKAQDLDNQNIKGKKNTQPNKLDKQKEQKKPKINGFKNNKITDLINKRAKNKKNDNPGQKRNDSDSKKDTEQDKKASNTSNKLANVGKAANALSQANQIKNEGVTEYAKNLAKQKIKQKVVLLILKFLPTILPIVGVIIIVIFGVLVLLSMIITFSGDYDATVKTIDTAYCNTVSLQTSSSTVSITDQEYIAFELSNSVANEIDNDEVIKSMAIIYRTNLYANTDTIENHICSIQISGDYEQPTDTKYLELVNETGREVYTFDTEKLSELPINEYFSWKSITKTATNEDAYDTYIDDYKYPKSWVDENVPKKWMNNDSTFTYGYSPFMAEYLVTQERDNDHDLLYHFFSYNPNDTSELAYQVGTIYKIDTGETEDESITDSGTSSSDYIYSSDCDGISLTTTSLSRDEFISKTESYASSHSFIKPLAAIAGDIYDLCKSSGFNPELVIIKAVEEGSPGESFHNYWGIGCYNGAKTSSCTNYASDIIGVQGLIKTMQSYHKSTLVDVLNVYSSIGSRWYSPGSSGSGGCYYYTYMLKYYTNQSRAEAVTASCKAGTEIATNDEDELAYAKYHMQTSVDYRKSIFNITADTCSSSILEGSDIYQLGKQISSKAVSTFDSYSYSQNKRGQVGYVDCSSMIDRTYQMFNIYYFYQNGWYGTTYTEKAWCESKGVLFSDTSTDNLIPGDLLFYHSYGHVEMYIGDGQKFGAHTDDYVQSAQVSVTTYQNGSAIAGCRPLSVYLREKS